MGQKATGLESLCKDSRVAYTISINEGCIMQKTVVGFLVVLLLSIFFYINGSDSDNKESGDTKAPTLVQKKEKVLIRESRRGAVSKTDDVELKKKDTIVKKKPFVSQIDLPLNDPSRRVATEADIKEAALKTDRELEKEIFADMQLRMTAEMQAIPDCLESAQNKKEALRCGKKLQDINREFELILGIERDPSTENNTEGFIWNEKTKENMIQQLDTSIASMQELFSCIQASDTDEEQKKCFEVEQR